MGPERVAERDRLAQEADGRAPRRRRHEALLRALARETEREDQLSTKLQRDTLALQAAAAADVRSLGALLARAPWGGLSAAEARTAAGEARALQEAKLALWLSRRRRAEAAKARAGGGAAGAATGGRSSLPKYFTTPSWRHVQDELDRAPEKAIALLSDWNEENLLPRWLEPTCKALFEERTRVAVHGANGAAEGAADAS